MILDYTFADSRTPRVYPPDSRRDEDKSFLPEERAALLLCGAEIAPAGKPHTWECASWPRGTDMNSIIDFLEKLP